MKVLVIGGVAAGTKVAAKLKREDRSIQVTLITKSRDISYAGCGLPYYVGGVIKDRAELIVNTPQSFSALTGADVQTGIEALGVDFAAKTVSAKNLATGEEVSYPYDRLVIATGASPVRPSIEGIDAIGVSYMRTPEDAVSLRADIEAGNIKRAAVIGGGFIGLEVAENLAAQGVRVNVVEMAPHILPMYDDEIAGYIENHLADRGINVMTSTKLTAILKDDAGRVAKIQTEKRAIKTDAVIMAVGIRPNTAFLEGTGLQMEKGAIVVNEKLETNIPDVYAVGDCCLVKNLQTGKPVWSAMGSTANIAGRIAAQNIAGKKDIPYQGVLGTAVIKLPDLNAGRTGLTEKEAKAAGIDYVAVMTALGDKAHYYPGSGVFLTKMIAEKETMKLLGVQVLGSGEVDKMIDIAVTAITLGGTLPVLSQMDLAYAPPFSTAIHPFAATASILMNKMQGEMDSFTPGEFAAGEADGYRIIDCSGSPNPLLHGAPFLDYTTFEEPPAGYEKSDKLLLVCNKGRRAYLTQNKLKQMGFTDTKVLEAATSFTREF